MYIILSYIIPHCVCVCVYTPYRLYLSLWVEIKVASMEYLGACFFSDHVFLQINAQEWACRSYLALFLVL